MKQIFKSKFFWLPFIITLFVAFLLGFFLGRDAIMCEMGTYCPGLEVGIIYGLIFILPGIIPALIISHIVYNFFKRNFKIAFISIVVTIGISLLVGILVHSIFLPSLKVMTADPFARCDFNRDGVCDNKDIAIFEKSLGKCMENKIHPNAMADMDFDGCITEKDKEILFPSAKKNETSQIIKGVTTKLIPLQQEYILGQPIPFRLEMTNNGSSIVNYDSQQVAVNDSMTIKDPEGQYVPYTSSMFQTLGGSRPLKPGETVILFDQLDIASQYQLAKPGRYTVQFRGQDRAFGEIPIPESNVVGIEVKIEEQGNLSILMDEISFSQGEIMSARVPNPDYKIYLNNLCGLFPGWKLYVKNVKGQWVATDNWYSTSITSCIPDCKNNAAYFSGCDGLCPTSAFECQRLKSDPSTQWGLKWYDPPRQGLCGNRQGTFSFVNNAPAGQYKLRFEYFEDNACQKQKFIEKIFTIADSSISEGSVCTIDTDCINLDCSQYPTTRQENKLGQCTFGGRRVCFNHKCVCQKICD